MSKALQSLEEWRRQGFFYTVLQHLLSDQAQSDDEGLHLKAV